LKSRIPQVIRSITIMRERRRRRRRKKEEEW